MALWQLLNLGTGCTWAQDCIFIHIVIRFVYIYIYTQALKCLLHGVRSGIQATMGTGTTFWAAPKQLKLDGNVSENYGKFDEHWVLFEKTELKG